jgi:hypothetical protein
MSILTICRRCGEVIEADRKRVLASGRALQFCDECQSQQERPPLATVACRECGRPLRAGTRAAARGTCGVCTGVTG